MNGLDFIKEERDRQILREGWSSEHDDNHTSNEMARAASVYAMNKGAREFMCQGNPDISIRELLWDWDDEFYKPSENRIKELSKAGALIAAEIDRLLRIEERENKLDKMDRYETY